MHNYESEHGHLPPAVVYGDDGRPLYSWRVLILPYIEQNDVYKEFHLDEPWDSPHNITLLPRMPSSYALPPRKQSRLPPHHTVCHVFVGKNAAFEGREGLCLARDFPDGTSNTLLLAEAGEPVPWSAPGDIAYDPDGPLPDLRCIFNDGFRAGMADCTTVFVTKGTSEATLRAAITRNGNEILGPDWGQP
jgi:hypothetical protein